MMKSRYAKVALPLAGAFILALGSRAPKAGAEAPEPPTEAAVAEAPQEAAEEAEAGAQGDAAPSTASYRDKSTLAPHKLARVTVYSDRADVVRAATLKLKPGLHWYEFSGLPATLDRHTVRVRPEQENPSRVAQVLVEERFERAGLPTDLQTKLDKLRARYGELLNQMQQERALDRHFHFVQNLRFEAPFRKDQSPQGYQGFGASPESLRASIEEIQRQSGSLSERLQLLHERKHLLNEEIGTSLRELEQYTTLNDQRWIAHVYVLLDGGGAGSGSFPLELSYQVPNAFWHPVYDVRADLDRTTGTATIKLVTAGMVEQHTAEDWSKVELTLSTLDPVPLFLPKLARWSFKETRTEAPPPPPRGGAVPGRTAKRLEEKADADSSMEGLKKQNEASRLRPKAKTADKEERQKNKDGTRESERFANATLAEQNAAPAAPAAPAAIAAPQPNEAMMDDEEADSSGVAFAGRKSGFGKDAGAGGSNGPVVATLGGKGSRSFGHGQGEGQSQEEYPLQPLEQHFPALAQISNQLASAQAAPQTRLTDPPRNPTAPQRISYNDSMLPAVQAGGRVVEFTSPFPFDLKNDSPATQVPVTTQKLTGDLNYFAIPKRDPRVFLKAKTTNTTSRPILGGAAQVFMDGDLVSKTSLGTISEGSYFDVDLGVDKNVETKRTVSRKSKDSGFIRTQHVSSVEVKIQVANHHPFPIKMELKDHFPMSPGKDIEVTLNDVKPETRKSDERKYGLLTWDLSLQPKTTKTVVFTYDVKHPENYLVSEFD